MERFGDVAAAFRHSLAGVLPVLRRIRSVSFSFYGEDTLLAHMHPQATGRYVDVGAFEPRVHSNTYRLYLRGWTGITIEPNPDAAPAFKAVRPRDEHLTIGIADRDAELIYYRFRDPAQNTFDAARALGLAAEKTGETHVRCMTLNEVFERYCRDRAVDLLNVDCECRDLQVIESLDWRTHRPTVVIVEDFEQFNVGASPVSPSSRIRSFMLSQDYALASQAVFSFLYVDRRAFARPARDSGFRLDRSELRHLA